MYMETTIIRNNKQIADFEFSPNEELNLYLRSHERAQGGDDWFYINSLTNEEVKTIKGLCKNYEEKELLSILKEGDGIDILLHFYVYIKR